MIIAENNNPNNRSYNNSQRVDAVLNDPLLINRHIASTAAAMGWERQGRSWRYPVYDRDGSIIAHRHKRRGAGEGNKYWWEGGKPKHRDDIYYHHPDLLTCIRQANGLLYIANGEPSVLAFHAAGIYNVISWFGETSVPATLADDLRRWGVKTVIYAPDRDSGGLKSAQKVKYDHLESTDITLKVLALPEHLAERADANDLLIHLDGDPGRFLDALNNLDALIVPRPAVKKQKRQQVNYTGDRFPPDFVRDVIRAVERLEGAKRSGDWINARSPFRDEKNASWGFNVKTLGWNDFTDNNTGGIIALGRILGINIEDYRDQPPPPPGRAGIDLAAAPGELPSSNSQYTTQVESSTDNSMTSSTANNHHLSETKTEDWTTAYKLLNAAAKATDERPASVKVDSDNQTVLKWMIERDLVTVTRETAQIITYALTTTGRDQLTDAFERQWQQRDSALTSVMPEPGETYDRQYVGQYHAGDAAEDSPLGTGKSHAARPVLNEARTAKGISARRILVNAMANNNGLDSYEDYCGEFAGTIAQAAKLAITTNSLHRIAGSTSPEILYIDEPGYVFRSFATEIMKRDTRDTSAAVLKRLLTEAGRVMVSQAEIDPVTWNILKSLRPSIQLYKNTYRPDRGEVDFITDASLIRARAFQTVRNGGIAAIVSDGRRDLQAMELAAKSEGLKVIAIHGENSQTSETQQHVKTINQEIRRAHDNGTGVLILLSPTADVGFSVDGKVNDDDDPVVVDYVGVISCNQVTPETLAQMTMRTRHAHRRQVYVPGHRSDDLPTDAKLILDDLRKELKNTADLADFAACGTVNVTDEQGWITRINAAYEAYDNFQKKDRIGFTAAFLDRAGFTPVLNLDTSGLDAAREWWRTVRSDYDEYSDDRTKRSTPLSPQEFEDIRSRGELTEDHFFGLKHWKILQAAAGRALADHPDVFERYKSKTNRHRLYRAEMLNKSRVELQQRDRDDVVALPVHRRHFTASFDFQLRAWSAALGRDVTCTSDIYAACESHVFTEDDTQRLFDFTMDYGFEQACKRVSYRTELDPTESENQPRIASGLLKALARSINFSLKSDRSQPTVNGKRLSILKYVADQESLQTAIDDLKHREKFVAADAPILQNAKESTFAISVQTYSLPGKSLENPAFQPPSPPRGGGMSLPQMQSVEF